MLNNVVNILYSNRKYYEKYYFHKHHTLAFYKGKLLDFFQKKTLYTEVTILGENDFYWEDDIHDILEKINKKPKAHFKNKEIDDVEVILYKYLSGGRKIKQEMHFYKRKLFYFNYLFSYFSEKDKRTVIQSLEKKYLNGKEFDNASCKIVDSKNNAIIVTDDVEFSINYVSFNHHFNKNLLNAMAIEKDDATNKNNYFFTNFLDKL